MLLPQNLTVIQLTINYDISLQRSQDPRSEALFTSSTFQAYNMAQNKLTRTRGLVAARNKELEELVREGGASNGAFVLSIMRFCTLCSAHARFVSRMCYPLLEL
jgi:hypothetical protein